MTPEQDQNNGSEWIEEEFSPRAIEAFMANYRDAQQAFLDIIDNAIDNRFDDKKLNVRIRVARNELSVYNEGGEGLDREGLRNFFKWGHSEKIDRIGQFGVGGKGAMGFLGRSMEVVCSAANSDLELRVYDPNWESRQEGEKKRFKPDVKRTQISEGYFRARITNLKKEVNSLTLAQKLGDIYRPLLLTERVKITVNGSEVEPLEIKYVEDDLNLKPESLTVQTRFGETFDLKVGVLAEGQKVKPGIRCYYRGRLIEDEQYFGHPTPAQMPQAARLIGEADLDFVPVTPNKSNFNHSSAQWIHASKRMRDVLEPWMAKIAKLEVSEKTPVENYEKELAKKAKRAVEHVLGIVGLITKKDLPGESSGRLPASPPKEKSRVSKRTRKLARNIEGLTPPAIGAIVGVDSVRRWGAFSSYDVVSMGNSDKRAEIVEEGTQQHLKINADYPLFQTAKKLGHDAQEVYISETAIMKICEVVSKDKPVSEFVELMNIYLKTCGAYYRSRVRPGR